MLIEIFPGGNAQNLGAVAQFPYSLLLFSEMIPGCVEGENERLTRHLGVAAQKHLHCPGVLWLLGALLGSAGEATAWVRPKLVAFPS